MRAAVFKQNQGHCDKYLFVTIKIYYKYVFVPFEQQLLLCNSEWFLWDMHLFHELASVQTFGDRYDYGVAHI